MPLAVPNVVMFYGQDVSGDATICVVISGGSCVRYVFGCLMCGLGVAFAGAPVSQLVLLAFSAEGLGLIAIPLVSCSSRS